MKEKFIKSKLFFIAVAMGGALLTAVGVWAATTIGNNIETTGNLTVSGDIGVKNELPMFDLDVNGDTRITNDHKLYFGGTGALDTAGYLQHDGADFIFSTAIKPTGYKASDGTPGITNTSTIRDRNNTNCKIYFNDGLLTSSNCPVDIPPT